MARSIRVVGMGDGYDDSLQRSSPLAVCEASQKVASEWRQYPQSNQTLWDRVAFVGLDQIGVRILNLSVRVHVIADVRGRYWLVYLTFDLLLVWFIHDPIGIRIGGEEAKEI